ncbi:MAG TPA: DUF72 domain-containing protein [Treponema sp.]|nr:DUF72 domain-containing protein [Treponema sp.]
MMSELRIGTCSWKYPSWTGLVYSAPEGIDFLAEYARSFDTVEVDQWFWSLFAGGKVVLPDRGVAEGYAAVVPGNFRFSVKIPNSVTLTHPYARNTGGALIPNVSFLSADLFARFVDSLGNLADKTNAWILQFEYLNKDKMADARTFRSALGLFLRELPRATGRSLPIFVEIRNPSWLTVDHFRFLEGEGAFPVFLQGYYMRDVRETWPAAEPFVRGRALFRLHGPDRAGIEKKTKEDWSRIVEPRDDEIDSLARLFSRLGAIGLDLIVNVNNHYEGSAPLTIRKLRDRLAEQGKAGEGRGGLI